jgi:hypothetical protein
MLKGTKNCALAHATRRFLTRRTAGRPGDAGFDSKDAIGGAHLPAICCDNGKDAGGFSGEAQ